MKFPFGMAYFQVQTVSFRECTNDLLVPSTKVIIRPVFLDHDMGGVHVVSADFLLMKKCILSIVEDAD